MGRWKPSLLDEPQVLSSNSASIARHRRAVYLCALVLLAFVAYNRPCAKETLLSHLAFQRNPSFLIRAHNGAVASENKRCSDIGVAVLKEGGNAVDAAIAATFCVGVVNMFS